MRMAISSGTIWEDKVGYSRAVRVGNIVEVAGTTALDGEKIIAQGDPYGQAVFIFNKIKKVLESAGSGFNDVIRTRMYITDIKYSGEVGRAHGEIFNKIKPASTMLAVSALVDPGLLVEIEVTAVLNSNEE